MKKMKGLSLLFPGLLVVLVLLVTNWIASAGVSTLVDAPLVAAAPQWDMPTAFVMDIHGRVTTPQGNSRMDWRVQVIRLDGKVADEAAVGRDGFYQLRPLPPTVYELQVVDGNGRILPLSPGSQSQVWPDGGSLVDEYLLIVEADMPDMTAVSIQGSGQITGVVTAGDNGLPLSSVYVVAYSLDGVYQDGDFTNSQGQYELIGLAAGDYKIRFQKLSSVYVTEWYDNQPNFDSATPVAVSEGGTTANINATLDVGGEITGQITAADTSLPLEDVRVVVYDSAGDYVDTVYANTTGVYTVTRLAADSYRLKFEPYGTADAYLREYYNDKPTLETADSIAVALGQVVVGIDATLTRGGEIHGTVTDATTGVPLADVVVSAYIDSVGSSCAGDFVLVNSATTDATGSYTLTRLPTGSYRLRFRPSSSGVSAAYLGEYYNNKPDLNTAVPTTTFFTRLRHTDCFMFLPLDF
ncbi:MAG: carboxypeptidase regulatory-like domain-containing protein [Anaerolinea sp.]|nr:carboxypeptidase regulatory-like domain-containing protein [Anaerolinea sp.]